MTEVAGPTTAKPAMDRALWGVVGAVVLGSVMSGIDATIVNVALAPLSRDLHTSLSSVQWVVSAYLLTLGAIVPLTAWLARRFPPGRLFLVAIVLFTIGSALCGLSSSIGELIAFRVVQGIGGGMIGPVGQAIMVRASGPRRLARVMSVFTVATIVVPMMGPTLGGLLIDSVGWRWIFYINIPIGVVAIVAGVRNIVAGPTEEPGRLDVTGFCLSAVGLIGLSYGLIEIGSSGDPIVHVVLPLAVGLAAGITYVMRALRMDEPLLDVRLYTNRAFSAASATIFAISASLFAAQLLFPLYLQTTRHQSAVQAGLIVALRGLGAILGTAISTRVSERIGAGPAIAGGAFLFLFCTIPFAMINGHSSLIVLCCFLVGQGIGVGAVYAPVMTAAFRALNRPDKIGDASAQLTIVTRVAGSLGAAILTTVLSRYLAAGYGSAQAFADTFRWVMVITAIGLVPIALLILVTRKPPPTVPVPLMTQAEQQAETTADPSLG